MLYPSASSVIYNMSESNPNIESSLEDRLAKLQRGFEELSAMVSRVSLKLHHLLFEFEWFAKAICEGNCTTEWDHSVSSSARSSVSALKHPVREDDEPVGTDVCERRVRIRPPPSAARAEGGGRHE